jgi:hypothetical protein
MDKRGLLQEKKVLTLAKPITVPHFLGYLLMVEKWTNQ